MIKEKELVDLCIKHGAAKAYVLEVDKITFNKDLRTYCEMNYCGSFGNNYACPPNVGEVNDLINNAKSYNKALVFQTITKIADSFDIEGMEEASIILEDITDLISKDIASNFDKYLILSAGGCKVCETCTIQNNKPCMFPEKQRASLEAYCMDVTNLAEQCSMICGGDPP